MTGTGDYLLTAKGVSKEFPGVKALVNVDFSVRRGEIHALAGENGAGKSTLMNILSGAFPADGGEIIFDGKPFAAANPLQAREMGISTIHQELNLIQKLSVAENIFLARQPKRLGVLIDRATMYRRAEAFCRDLGIDLDVHARVGSLSMGKQQMVEIVKAVSFDAKLIIMDEPTSSLTLNESKILFRIIKQLTQRGISAIFITHRLDEIFEISDRITVLRDGQFVGMKEIAETSRQDVITMMVGRKLTQQYPSRVSNIGDECLRVEHLSDTVGNVKDASFSLRRGEVLGFAGLVGAGRTELMRLVFGADPISAGTIKVNGKPTKICSPQDAINANIAMLTEDRKSEGLLLNSSVARNTVMASLHKVVRRGFIRRHLENEAAQKYVQELSISTPSVSQRAGYLSGGNQQKVVLGKWLFSDASIIIMDEPTRGIDVGAKRDIYELINGLVAEQKAVIVVSSEIEEIMGISDRVLIMREGRIVGELDKEQMSQSRIMEYAVEGKAHE